MEYIHLRSNFPGGNRIILSEGFVTLHTICKTSSSFALLSSLFFLRLSHKPRLLKHFKIRSMGLESFEKILKISKISLVSNYRICTYSICIKLQALCAFLHSKKAFLVLQNYHHCAMRLSKLNKQ